MALINFDGPYIHLPVSLNQEILLLSEDNPDLNTIRSRLNLSIGIRLSGLLDCRAINIALTSLLRRHAGLRSAFFRNLAISKNHRARRVLAFAQTGLFDSGLYLHSICEEINLTEQVTDLSSHFKSPAGEISRLIAKQTENVFDFRSPPLLRATLMKLETQEHLLVLVAPKLVCDVSSMNILCRDLASLYEEVLAGQKGTSEVIPSGSDFAIWQNALMQAGYFRNHINYWREQWATFGSSRIAYWHLPFSRPQARSDYRFASIRLRLTPSEATEVRAFLERSGATLDLLFITAFIVVLHHYTKKERLAIVVNFPKGLSAN